MKELLPIRIENELRDSALERHRQRVEYLSKRETDALRKAVRNVVNGDRNDPEKNIEIRAYVDASRNLIKEQICTRVPAQRTLMLFGKPYSLPPKMIPTY